MNERLYLVYTPAYDPDANRIKMLLFRSLKLQNILASIEGSKRNKRRVRIAARHHQLGGSGATIQYVLPRRLRSVRYYKQVNIPIAMEK